MIVLGHVHPVIIIKRRVKFSISVVAVDLLQTLLPVAVNIPERIVQIDKKMLV